MKILAFSRLPIVISIALGLLVFWIAASPVAEGAGLIIGGFWPTLPGYCCTQEAGYCSGAQAGPGEPTGVCSSGNGLTWCNGDEPEEGATCHAADDIPCNRNGSLPSDPLFCFTTHSGECY